MPGTDLTTVAFHGTELLVVPGATPTDTLVVMKPVVEAMGLDWGGQHKKIVAHQVLRTCVSVKKMQMPGGGQVREVVCLPLNKLNFWLATIDASRMRNETARENVLRYQGECADVLFNHFFAKAVAVVSPGGALAPFTAEQRRALGGIVKGIVAKDGRDRDEALNRLARVTDDALQRVAKAADEQLTAVWRKLADVERSMQAAARPAVGDYRTPAQVLRAKGVPPGKLAR